jgi:hypothetical protein
MFLIKRFILFSLMSLMLYSCGYAKLAVGKIQARLHPTPENLRSSSPEKSLLVTGKVVGNIGKGVPLAVVAVTYWEKTGSIMSHAFLSAPGPYYLFLPEGNYQILVFADINGDSLIEKNELISCCGDSCSLSVERKKAVKGIIKAEDISVNPDRARSSDVPVSLEVPTIKGARLSGHIASGIITTLDDERFDEENGYLGLYQPVAYFERVNGFFYMLEEYDREKIPVIFVHGIEGSPKDWRSIVEGLDRKHFQPWFFYYPSGLRLETVAEIFNETFLSTGSQRIDSMIIAAYSQGGLIVREAMNICNSGKKQENIPQLYISFSTPYGGVDVAASAVAHSPVVVPSWIDLASDSVFIIALYRNELPQGTKFDLFFAYGSSHFFKFGQNDDGTITLKSQLNPKAQKEATQIRGFNETHSEILTNREVDDEFNSILAGARF